MSIHIEEEGEEGGYTLMSTLFLNGRPLIASACPSVARMWATKLDEARGAGVRRAMQILTGDLGMCEDAARNVIEGLTGTSPNLN